MSWIAVPCVKVRNTRTWAWMSKETYICIAMYPQVKLPKK